MMTMPNRTLDQRMQALVRANEIRTYRARLKRGIHDGVVDGRALILDPPEKLLTMKVYQLILTFPGVGRTKANKAMRCSQTSFAKTLGGLSDRQRQEIVKSLEPQARKLAA